MVTGIINSTCDTIGYINGSYMNKKTFFFVSGSMAYHGHRVMVYDNKVDILNGAYEIIQEDKRVLRQEGLLLQKNFLVSFYAVNSSNFSF